MSWKQQLFPVTAGRSFNSSETLAGRSLVLVKQSVKLMGWQTITSDLNEERLHWSVALVTSIRLFYSL